MFKKPFSFKGRIRRKEYGFSLLIYMGIFMSMEFIVIASLRGGGSEMISIGSFLFLALLIPLVWFMWAQGAKRCHDLGHSGWWQLIPFYGFIMLLKDGYRGINQYGDDPKFPVEKQFSFEGEKVVE